MIAIGKSYLKCAAVAYGWLAADVKGGFSAEAREGVKGLGGIGRKGVYLARVFSAKGGRREGFGVFDAEGHKAQMGFGGLGLIGE